MTQNEATELLNSIERERVNTLHDLYLVTGQLNSRTNDPVDSWTFFQWLQNKGIPSRYIIWKEHFMYQKLLSTNSTKDVVALDGDGMDYELLVKHADLLKRCRAFVQENAALNYDIHNWLYLLPDCRLVFLQHGPTGVGSSKLTWLHFPRFNDMNVNSAFEKQLVESLMPEPKWSEDLCFIGGLPRYDHCQDLSREISDNYIFVMFTWRRSFEQGVERIHQSHYWKKITAFFSSERIHLLEEKNVKLVVAMHHHIQNHIEGFDLGPNVKFIRQDEIAYWIRHAKACITDCSSVSYDFLFQHKPTMYWIPDKDDPLLDINDSDDGAKVIAAIKFQKHLFNICNSAEELTEKILYYANRDFQLEPELISKTDKFFDCRSGFSERVYYQIENRLSAEAQGTIRSLREKQHEADERERLTRLSFQKLSEKNHKHLLWLRFFAYLCFILLSVIIYLLTHE